ncbi:MAG: hypothetical protein AAF928_20955 [Myxococcota bacterium]
MAETKVGASRSEGVGLLKLDDIEKEWRFEPAVGAAQVVGVIAMSLGGLALGAGAFAGLGLDEDASLAASAPYLIAGGLVALALYFLFGRSRTAPLRVGDFGIGVEDGDRVQRSAWYQIESVRFAAGALTLRPPGRTIVVPVSAHPQAVRRIAAEAEARIPERCSLDGTSFEAPRPEEEARVSAEPPQVTSLRCAASDRALTIEKDVRFCSRCAVAFHRRHVPKRCGACRSAFTMKRKGRARAKK